MSRFRFSVGPWNVHEGADAFGPAVRDAIPFEEKVARFADIGFSAVQFHDDDAVPDINNLTRNQIVDCARDGKAILDRHGLAAEFVAPRLWMDPHTIDGGFTSNSREDREFALWRALRSIDIARTLGCNHIVLWLAREGTLCYESKDPVLSVRRLIDALDAILAYDSAIRIMVEPKPNEPIDRSSCPTMGHVLALSAATADPARVGGYWSRLTPSWPPGPGKRNRFRLSMGKLWSVHLNDSKRHEVRSGQGLRRGEPQAGFQSGQGAGGAGLRSGRRIRGPGTSRPCAPAAGGLLRPFGQQPAHRENCWRTRRPGSTMGSRRSALPSAITRPSRCTSWSYLMGG